MASCRLRLYPRFAAARISAALRDTPVVLVNGPRQVGKTTLVRKLVAGARTYVTHDDATALAAARVDPTGFVRRFDRVTIAEIHLGTRSVLEYLLSPVRKAFHEAARER